MSSIEANSKVHLNTLLAMFPRSVEESNPAKAKVPSFDKVTFSKVGGGVADEVSSTLMKSLLCANTVV